MGLWKTGSGARVLVYGLDEAGDDIPLSVDSDGKLVLSPTTQAIVAGAWATIIDGVQLDDDPTTYNSSNVDTSGQAAIMLLVDIDSTLAPTTVRLIAQFSDDDGTTWWSFEEGFWASLMWEDTETAAGINKVFVLPVAGVDLVRIRAVAAGTDAANYFTVTVRARPFRGAFAVAHS